MTTEQILALIAERDKRWQAAKSRCFSLLDSTQGNLDRDSITGFGMSQIDLVLRRRFFVSERASLEIRAEGFNILNQAAFADPLRFLSSPLFGEAQSMLNLTLGGSSPSTRSTPAFQIRVPRSLQLILRLHFLIPDPPLSWATVSLLSLWIVSRRLRNDRNGSSGESDRCVREDDGRESAFSHGPHDGSFFGR